MAVILTSKATVLAVRYLLNVGFQYVLTRINNGDSVEFVFSWAGNREGNKYKLHSRAATFAFDKMAKIGAIDAPKTGNSGAFSQLTQFPWSEVREQ